MTERRGERLGRVGRGLIMNFLAYNVVPSRKLNNI